MKITYIDRNGKPQMIEGFDTMSDDDEWVTMIFDGKKKMLHKCDIFERTYIVYTDHDNL